MEVSTPWLIVLGLPWSLLAFLLVKGAAAALRRPKPLNLPGKYTVQVDGDFVVFVIGIYRQPGVWLWNLRTAIRAGAAMQAMVRELEQHPEYGCMVVRHTEDFLANPTRQLLIWRRQVRFTLGGTAELPGDQALQSHNSSLDLYDHLAGYARNHMAKHLGAWLQWDKAARGFAGGEVPGIGIYHETYLVKEGAYEAIYRGMPRSGLAEIGRVVDASEGRMRTGKGRLGQTDGSDHDKVGY